MITLLAPSLMMLVSAATTAPAPGPYEVTHHSAEVTTPSWKGLCGEVPVAMPAPKQVEVKLYDKGTKWWIDGGEHFRIGTDLCFGRNPSLKINGQTATGSNWQLSCASERVVKGTETSGHRLLVEGDKITITHVSEVHQFQRRSQCKSKIERRIVLLKLPGGPGAPPPRAMKKKTSVLDIEAELEAELKRATERLASGVLKIEHKNTLPGDFLAMQADYVLDGKQIMSRMDTPLLRSGTQAVILDGVAPAGVHVLEVALTYRVRNAGRNYRVTLKDAIFFDMKENKPTVVVVQTAEKSGFLLEKTEAAKIEFFVDGKKPDRKKGAAKP